MSRRKIIFLKSRCTGSWKSPELSFESHEVVENIIIFIMKLDGYPSIPIKTELRFERREPRGGCKDFMVCNLIA